MSESLVVFDRLGELRAGHREAGILWLSGAEDVPSSTRQPELWVVPEAKVLSASLLQRLPPSKKRKLLLLEEPGPGLSWPLLGRFERVIAHNPSTRFLHMEELLEVLLAPNREELLIGVSVDENSRQVALLLGDLRFLLVPMTSFTGAAGAPSPDFGDAEVIDGGQTLRLGEFEAAIDALLYENDPAYRRRERARRTEIEQSFGASLRRLRLQRGLKLSDFAETGLSEKTIGRIERGEVKTPHPTTIARLAERLGVAPHLLSTF